MFPNLKLLCLLFMGPTLDFDTKQRNSFLIEFCVFYNKSRILTILFIVKYEKITLFDEFLVLLGPIISRFFAGSNEEKINKQKQQRVLALVLSMWIIVWCDSYCKGNKSHCAVDGEINHPKTNIFHPIFD
jgi:hypothetical protein